MEKKNTYSRKGLPPTTVREEVSKLRAHFTSGNREKKKLRGGGKIARIRWLPGRGGNASRKASPKKIASLKKETELQA